MKNYDELIKTYPHNHPPLPKEYREIYTKHYEENRNGKTKMSSISSKMERWLHKKVACTSSYNKSTLELGAGTLNQLNYESSKIYDIVEPFEELYKASPNEAKVTNKFKDISEVPLENRYDRIIAIASFEHISNLPEVVEKCKLLLKPDGILCVAIPNEGHFLWKLGYTLTTGIEFKKRYGLNYEVMMKHEHVNTADEIELILKHSFRNTKLTLFGIGKTFSLYRFYQCSNSK